MIKNDKKLTVVAHICNLKTWEIEARRGGVQDEKKERTGVRALTAQALEPEFRSLGPTQKKLGWTGTVRGQKQNCWCLLAASLAQVQ